MSDANETPHDSQNTGVELETGIAQVEWSAPLPPPAVLGQYDAVVPGAADRILTMAENAQHHIHDQERASLETARMVVASEAKLRFLGVGAGFVISLLGMGGSIYLISAGHDWAGLTLGCINLTSLVGVFVYGANARRAEHRRGLEGG